MSKQEGVIKFHLHYSYAPALEIELVDVLNHWRTVLYNRHLIGQDPTRYEGYGFGNISGRLEPFEQPPSERAFLITGTQTGHFPELKPTHFAEVFAYDPPSNRVSARGPVKPSSESMTHGAVYACHPTCRFVFHVHSPNLWHAALHLGIPITDQAVPYGTPAMSDEVKRLFRETDVKKKGIFSMGGHEDGLISFGRTANEAGTILLRFLEKV